MLLSSDEPATDFGRWAEEVKPVAVIERHTIRASATSESEIVIGRGIATMAELLPAFHGTVVFLTQPGVKGLAEELAAEHQGVAMVRQLPDGEAAKNLAVVGETYEWLNGTGFNRDDVIVGVGGGALTDVAGFVGATYLRGVEVVYLPTTLLGAVDASVGGKTGVNVGGKNLAGVFRHPRRVVVDLDLLDRIPNHLWVEGSAEVVKAGLIADPAIVAAYELEGSRAPLEAVVPAAIAVKVEAVTSDFHEKGRRAILNYGHTIGHAVEVAAGIPHGHAVAVGMVAAGAVAEELVGFAGAGRQRALLEGIGLPVEVPGVVRGQVENLIARDKKRDSNGVRMVLLEEIGRPVIRHVPDVLLRVGLDAIGVGASVTESAE